MVRCKYTDFWIFIPWNSKSFKKALKTAIEKSSTIYATKLATVKFRKVKSPEFPKELASMENKLVHKTYKFGVLYCKDGQVKESDMFRNVEQSNEFTEFLEFLGDRIALKGWTGYRGGLDVKTDTTGTHSVFTSFTGLDVMFHVSTLIPFTPNDEQQIERKRHLGNDIVMVVFKDTDNEPFSPNCVKSEFNHIFAIISPDRTKQGPKRFYRFAFGVKQGGKIVEPALPSPCVFEKNEKFRAFLLAKLINCERATMQGPTFKGKMVHAKGQQMQLLVNEFKNK